jgi:hypothetical protein
MRSGATSSDRLKLKNWTAASPSNAEDRRRAADAESERQDCDGGETTVLQQLAPGERDVLPQFGDILRTVHTAVSSFPSI